MTERILTAAEVLTGTPGEVIPDGAVLIRDGLIEDVGPAADVTARAAAGTPRASFPGARILPGLIDVHVHLVFDGGDDPVGALAATDDATLTLDVAERARRLLDVGVTTVRDLGDRGGIAARLRDAVNAGTIPGPRVLTSGTPITVTGGHCSFLGGQADGAEQVRALVRRLAEDGVDVIKMMVTGGHLTEGGPSSWELQYTAEEVGAAVEEASRFGLRVAAHVHSREGVEIALAAGAHTLEHCTLLTEAGPAAGPDADEKLIRTIAEKGVFVCPTFHGGMGALEARFGADVLRPWLDIRRHQHEQGVRLVAGTDAGITGVQVEEYAEGLRWLGRAGLPADAVIAMATSVAADALDLGGRTGRLRPGLDADLIVVDGDPLADLSVLRHPRLVVARGRFHLPRAEESLPWE
ncbi:MULTISPECIES: amidohydrolase family protein [Actinomadura]|uniref:Amidohydrolase family protein n=1 Tax=Actinomadura litoris TaxID=2678616 RepID=A0A7K1L4V3_9ACTN|nr:MULTISPECIES: amidohydrolase family protein [Actinomadura]MBT2212484.1 amidohydrolase family protein [Actinomadura sp. NEAU-AAG7]MUN39462.1 amidohydrolase family protein [Actinomadura litoris]